MSGKPAARTAIQKDTAAKLTEWKGEDGKTVDGDETELVEFEETTTSESEVSIVVLEDEDDDEYSPPPAQQITELRSRAIESSHQPAAWPTHHNADLRNPRTPPPLLFGSRRLDQHEFTYDGIPPQYVSPRGHQPREPPPADIMFNAPPRDHTAAPQQRIQLRPLAGLPPHYDYPPPPPTRAGLEQQMWTAAHVPRERYVPPPPGYGQPPPQLYAQGSYGAIQYRPLPPIGQAVDPRSAPTIRYRPLSPDDVLPSKEVYSPVYRGYDHQTGPVRY
jgi:hypothetical protein